MLINIIMTTLGILIRNRRLSIDKLAVVAALLATTASSSFGWNRRANVGTGTYVESAGPVSIYSSPNGGAEQAILNEIDHAHTRILVEAYSLTSAPIYPTPRRVASTSASWSTRMPGTSASGAPAHVTSWHTAYR